MSQRRCGLVGILLVLLTACASSADESGSTPRAVRALRPTATPRAVGNFDLGNAWLYGTPTPTVSPTPTGTPGPSPTATVTPTPVNGETLKGKLLFLSSRPFPAAYAPAAPPPGRLLNPDLLANWGGSVVAPVWQFDPADYRVTPCDPPVATPTAYPAGQPTPATLFSDLGNVLNQPRRASACQAVYDAARQAQLLSADKRFEVYVGADPNGGRPQIFVIDHTDQTKKMVTRFGAGVSYDPAFAPDGYRIAFISQETGQDNLYVVTRDGTEFKRLTRLAGQAWTTTWEWIKRPTWSADGTQLAFWSNRVSGARQIWIVNADGTNLHSISADPRPSEDWDPVWVR